MKGLKSFKAESVLPLGASLSLCLSICTYYSARLFQENDAQAFHVALWNKSVSISPAHSQNFLWSRPHLCHLDPPNFWQKKMFYLVSCVKKFSVHFERSLVFEKGNLYANLLVAGRTVSFAQVWEGGRILLRERPENGCLTPYDSLKPVQHFLRLFAVWSSRGARHSFFIPHFHIF